MDVLFVLGHESRLRILQRAAARVPGCAYLCAWAPLAGGRRPASSSSSSSAATSARLLRCLDAWLCDRGDDGSSRVRALFDAYRGSRCAAVRGCVPGWAYMDGRAYMELPAHDLTSSALLPDQQRFYQEAGIEMAAFLGCEKGEIEVGMSTAASGSPDVNSLETNLQQVFSEEFFQQSLVEEFLHLPPTRPSSSPSSSLPSVSVDDSPAAEGSTSLLRTTMAVTTSSGGGEPHVPVPPLLLHPARPPPRAGAGRLFGGYAHFPSPEADDALMAQAMLDVISATTSSSLLPTPSTAAPAPSSQVNHRARGRWPRRGGAATAFRAYNAALAPRAAPRRPGQRMIKMGFSILRRMQTLRFTSWDGAATVAHQQLGQQLDDDEAPEDQPPAAPSSSQLNHMISERRRRERLNESFDALRGLLPPGSKKDKATVLAKTLEYMNILVSQISELEARNRALESRTHANGGSKAAGLTYYSSSEPRAAAAVQQQLQQGRRSGGGSTTSSSTERRVVQVHVSSSGGASTTSREVTVRVDGDDVAELVTRVLAAIRATGRFTVSSVDARGRPGGATTAQATFTLRGTVGDLDDEASLKEAVTKAAEDSATAPSSDDS